MVDSNVAPLSAEQSRIGRATMGASVDALALKAGVAPGEIAALEAGIVVEPAVALRMQEAFADAGITFHLEADGSTRMRVRTLDGIIEAPLGFR